VAVDRLRLGVCQLHWALTTCVLETRQRSGTQFFIRNRSTAAL